MISPSPRGREPALAAWSCSASSSSPFFPARCPVSEQDLSMPFLPEFNGFSYLELSGLQSFVPDLQ